MHHFIGTQGEHFFYWIQVTGVGEIVALGSEEILALQIFFICIWKVFVNIGIIYECIDRMIQTVILYGKALFRN